MPCLPVAPSLCHACLAERLRFGCGVRTWGAGTTSRAAACVRQPWRRGSPPCSSKLRLASFRSNSRLRTPRLALPSQSRSCTDRGMADGRLPGSQGALCLACAMPACHARLSLSSNGCIGLGSCRRSPAGTHRVCKAGRRQPPCSTCSLVEAAAGVLPGQSRAAHHAQVRQMGLGGTHCTRGPENARVQPGPCARSELSTDAGTPDGHHSALQGYLPPTATRHDRFGRMLSWCRRCCSKAPSMSGRRHPQSMRRACLLAVSGAAGHQLCWRATGRRRQRRLPLTPREWHAPSPAAAPSQTSKRAWPAQACWRLAAQRAACKLASACCSTHPGQLQHEARTDSCCHTAACRRQAGGAAQSQ